MDKQTRIMHRWAKVIGGITYRIAMSNADFHKACNFHREVFLEDEPLTRLMGGKRRTNASKGEEKITKMLQHGVSIMAEDTDNHSKLIGTRIGYIVDGGERQDRLARQGDAIGGMFDRLIDLSVTTGDAGKMYVFHSLAVDREYRQRGIATNLARAAVEVAKLSGCRAVLAVGASPHAKKILEKLEFDHLKSEQFRADPVLVTFSRKLLL